MRREVIYCILLTAAFGCNPKPKGQTMSRSDLLKLTNFDYTKKSEISIHVDSSAVPLNIRGSLISKINYTTAKTFNFDIKQARKINISYDIPLPEKQELLFNGVALPFIVIPGKKTEFKVCSQDGAVKIEYLSDQTINSYIYSTANEIEQLRVFEATLLNNTTRSASQIYHSLDSIKKLKAKRLEIGKKDLPPWFYLFEKKELTYDNFNKKFIYLNNTENYKSVNRESEKSDIFLENIMPYDSLAILNNSYYDFLRWYIFHLQEEQYEKLISGYKSKSYEEKTKLRSFMARTENKMSFPDSTEIKHWIYVLEKSRKLLPELESEYFGFKYSSVNSHLIPSPDHESVHSLYYYFSTFNNDRLKKRIENNLSKKLILTKGEPAPNFHLIDQSLNKSYTLRDFEGKVVLLSFWFPGCKPCIEEFEFERELIEDINSTNFSLINICLTKSPTLFVKLNKKYRVQGLSLTPTEEDYTSLIDNYGVYSFPKYVLIDTEGKVVASHAPKPSSEELQPLIRAALGKTSF